VFVGCMALVCLTALGLCGARLLARPSPGARFMAVFLGFLAVVTGAGAYKGVRVLRTKHRRGPNRNPLDLGVAGAVLAAGAAMIALAGWWRSPLYAVVGALGGLAGWSSLRYWLRPPAQRMHWWLMHMGDMVGTGIAAVTAFLVGARGLDGPAALLAWVLPSALGLPLLALWQRHHRRRFLAADAGRDVQALRSSIGRGTQGTPGGHSSAALSQPPA
jgi:hypothetical protein